MKWVLAFLILLAPLPAKAMFHRGSASGCPFPTAIGAPIFPSNTSCYLSFGGYWNFTGAPWGASNYDLHNCSIPLGGTCGSDVGAVRATLCAGFSGSFSTYLSYDVIIGGQEYWVNDSAYQIQTQSMSACNPATSQFKDITKGTSWPDITDLILNASPNDVLQIQAAPSGIPQWVWAGSPSSLSTGSINVEGLTINIDAGAKFCCALSAQPPGQAYWVLQSSGITVNGGDFSSPLRISNNVTGTTIENGSVHDTASYSTSAILSGSGDGTITLINETIYNGGDVQGSGSDHNVYISANVAGDATANVQVTNLSSYDVTGGGWTFKTRPLGIGTQNHITGSYFFCTKTGSGCNQNGIFDMPCGGNYLLDYSVFEQGPGADNWYGIRAMEEPFAGPGGTNCPSNPASWTNSFTFDHDIIILDGPAPGGGGHDVAICISPNTGTTCLSSNPNNVTCSITNSVLVGNDAIALVPGGGCTEDAYTVAHTYVNRTAAAADMGWSGADWQGNPCCAFPWRPTHP